MTEKVKLSPREIFPERYQGMLFYVKWVPDTTKCSHITAMCEFCQPQWDRLFRINP